MLLTGKKERKQQEIELCNAVYDWQCMGERDVMAQTLTPNSSTPHHAPAPLP